MSRSDEALFVACSGHRVPSCGRSTLSASIGQQTAARSTVLRRQADFYATGERPGPADILLLIEFADSSLRYDQTVQPTLYARTGTGEVWSMQSTEEPRGQRH